MQKEKEKEAVKEKKLTVKVVSYTDYLLEAANQCKNGGDKFNRAIELLYSNNEVIATVNKGGETRFICKV